MTADVRAAAEAMCKVGAAFYARGWCMATAGNFSVVVGREPTRLLVTASGKHKGRLAPADFLTVDGDGKPVDDSRKPSAEVALHAMLTRRPGVGAVLHTHTPWNTLLSDRYESAGGFSIEGYELLKALSGVSTHDHRERVPVYANTQDIPALARHIEADMNRPEVAGVHSFLLGRHGLYTWGRDLEEAERHVEALEFLFECVWRREAALGPPANKRGE